MPKIKLFLSHLQKSQSIVSLNKHILKGTAVAVSDGSYYPHSQVGAYAWIISSPDGLSWIKGGGIILGSKKD